MKRAILAAALCALSACATTQRVADITCDSRPTIRAALDRLDQICAFLPEEDR